MQKIRELRQARNWTQFELALKVGVHPQAVYLWESGRRTPQVAQLRKLGCIFGLCSDDIELEHRPDRAKKSSASTSKGDPSTDTSSMPSENEGNGVAVGQVD